MMTGESEMELWRWKQKRETERQRQKKTVTGRKRVIVRCKTARFEDGGRAQEPSRQPLEAEMGRVIDSSIGASVYNKALLTT